MRKSIKNKARCCGLCKPHKRGRMNRWTSKEKANQKAALIQIMRWDEELGLYEN